MGQSRVSKFERMLKYQSNQVELLQQQIAVQNALISALNQEHLQLCKRLQDLQTNHKPSSNLVSTYQQCEVAMIEAQKLIKAKRIQIATADEKLDHLLHTYRDEEQRLKAWEKLVDREKLKGRAALSSSEIREADEIFLLSKLGRVNL